MIRRRLAGIPSPLLLVWLAASSVPGQPTPNTVASGMSPVLAVLFKDYEAFTARAEVELTGPRFEDAMIMPMKFYYLKGDTRTELDMGDVIGPSVDESLAHTLQQIGMHEVVTILQAQRGQTVVLYPRRKAYVLMPNPSANEQGQPRPALIRKTKLGEETVLGMTCTKSRVTFVEGPGRNDTVHVWEAERLRQFPVQIEMKQTDGAMTVRYRDVSFEDPGPERFEIPEGFQKHDGAPSILQEATRELLKPDAKP
jgi:hypothetical protein